MMKDFIQLEKNSRIFTAILIALLLVGCQTVSPLHYLKGEGAFLPAEQMLAPVNEHYPNAQLLEVRLKRGKGSHFHRNYRYEIKLATEHRSNYRILEIDAHDGRILSDKPFNCGLLKRCSWK